MTKRTRTPFVTFEGTEGAGKTTQIRRVSDALRDKGILHLVTREPGGTPLADEIRALILSPRDEAVAPEAELLLYEAARAQHVRSIILPALAAGTPVLCDRFIDATVAYQGAARKLPPDAISWLNGFAAGGAIPDLTILFDVDPAIGATRAARRGGGPDRIESESRAFHDAVRIGYLDIAKAHPGRISVVDASRDQRAVFDATMAILSDRFGW